MATITEDYVSFETAKLLKEKGFDSEEVGCHGGFYSERCYHSGYGIITDSGQEVGIVYDDLRNADLEYDEYLRPTLQMAMKWLREEFDLITYVKLVNDEDLCHDAWGFSIYNKFTNESIKGHTLQFKYEEACEVAIKYCLENLI